MGGSCGDIITGMIDPMSVSVTDKHTISIPETRRLLKVPHKMTDADKDKYVSQQHTSISSHDFEYHKSRQHKILYIQVRDFDVAMWAARRFKDLHFAHAWREMTEKCGAETIEQYAQMYIDNGYMVSQYPHADVIDIQDIRSGRAGQVLTDLGFTISLPGQELYQTWLEANNLC